MKRLLALIIVCVFSSSVMYGGFITNGTKYYLVRTIMFSFENGQEVIDFDPSEEDAVYMYFLITDKKSAITTDRFGKKNFYDYEGKTKTGGDLYSKESDFRFFNGPMIFYLQVEKDKIILYNNKIVGDKK